MARRIYMREDPLPPDCGEKSPKFRVCHTMVTAEPSREVAATGHDRCFVVLLGHEIELWLTCEIPADFHRQEGMLQVESGVPTPRARRTPLLSLATWRIVLAANRGQQEGNQSTPSALKTASAGSA